MMEEGATAMDRIFPLATHAAEDDG